MDNEIDFDTSQVDLKAKLQLHLPVLITLMGDTPFTWVDVNRLFIEKYSIRHENYVAANHYLVVEINFFDVISQALLGNRNYLLLYTYFKRLMEELDMQLAPEKKALLSGTFRSLLTNWDLKFLNFIGELSVLNNLLKSGYQLDIVEEEMPNGKHMDFTVINQNGNKALVEVRNIHLHEGGDKTDRQLVSKIKRKLTRKINTKSKNGLPGIVFHIVPVIWAPHKVLLRLKALYDQNLNMLHLNILEPVAYACFTYENDYVIKFGSVKSLFDLPII